MFIGLAFSGGLDSYIAYKYAQKVTGVKPDLIYIDMGVGYNKYEKQAIKKLGFEKIVKVINVSNIHKDGSFNKDNIMIPGRNMFIANTLAQMGYRTIWLPAVRGEMHSYSKDKNVSFFVELSAHLSKVYGYDIKVTTPFINMGKKDIVRLYLEDFGGSKQQLLNTRSCLNNKKELCGVCTACVRRWGIFNQFGFQDSLVGNPLDSPYLKKLVEEYVYGNNFHFREERFDEIIQVAHEELVVDMKKVDWQKVKSWYIDDAVAAKDYAIVKKVLNERRAYEIGSGGFYEAWKGLGDCIHTDGYLGLKKVKIDKCKVPKWRIIVGVNCLYCLSFEEIDSFLKNNKGRELIATFDLKNIYRSGRMKYLSAISFGYTKRKLSRILLIEEYESMYVDKVLLNGII